MVLLQFTAHSLGKQFRDDPVGLHDIPKRFGQNEHKKKKQHTYSNHGDRYHVEYVEIL